MPLHRLRLNSALWLHRCLLRGRRRLSHLQRHCFPCCARLRCSMVLLLGGRALLRGHMSLVGIQSGQLS